MSKSLLFSLPFGALVITVSQYNIEMLNKHLRAEFWVLLCCFTESREIKEAP